MDETRVGEMLSSQGKYDWLQSIRKEFKNYHKSTDKAEDDAATILQDERHTLISIKWKNGPQEAIIRTISLLTATTSAS